MVFFFKSRCGEYTIYMGRDKFENEELIKYGLPEDVWFHVDDLSSAHVYLRLHPGQTMDDITDDLILDCSSLVKANSIAGVKKASVYVIYTRWKNLKKTSSMADGCVSYHRPENVRRVQVEKNNPIVREIEKNRVERNPDLAQEQMDREREINRDKKRFYKAEAKKKQHAKQAQVQEKEARSYDRIMEMGNMVSNTDVKSSIDASAAEEFEDDFF